jgi:hypothetical protein
LCTPQPRNTTETLRCSARIGSNALLKRIRGGGEIDGPGFANDQEINVAVDGEVVDSVVAGAAEVGREP